MARFNKKGGWPNSHRKLDHHHRNRASASVTQMTNERIIVCIHKLRKKIGRRTCRTFLTILRRTAYPIHFLCVCKATIFFRFLSISIRNWVFEVKVDAKCRVRKTSVSHVWKQFKTPPAQGAAARVFPFDEEHNRHRQPAFGRQRARSNYIKWREAWEAANELRK